MNYFLELNSEFSGLECHVVTEDLARMYEKWFKKKGLLYKEIFVKYEDAGFSRKIFQVESDLDLTIENGIHSHSAASTLHSNSKRYTNWVRVDVFLENSPDYSDGYVIEPRRGGMNHAPSVTATDGDGNSIEISAFRSQRDNSKMAVTYLHSKADFEPNMKIVRRYSLQPVAWIHDYVNNIETRDVFRVLEGNLDLFYANKCG